MSNEITAPSPLQGSLPRDLQIAEDEAKSGLDWPAAIEHLCQSRAPYCDAPAHSWKQYQSVIEHTYKPLTDRWHAGERTPELHAAMMALPL